jgi:hypothetical protein
MGYHSQSVWLSVKGNAVALRACKECGEHISSDAKFCENCGKPQARKGLGWAGGLLVLALIGVVGLMLDHGSGGTGGPKSDASGEKTAAPKVDSAQEAPAWEYGSNVDQMGRGTSMFASLKSVNSADFRFPYNGENHGSITLWKSPESGTEAVFEVEKGQILCSFSGDEGGRLDCPVSLKVDDGPLVRVTGRQPSDGRSNVVIVPYEAVLSSVEKAKVLRVEATFFQEGPQVFEFHPEGLDVKRLEEK